MSNTENENQLVKKPQIYHFTTGPGGQRSSCTVGEVWLSNSLGVWLY